MLLEALLKPLWEEKMVKPRHAVIKVCHVRLRRWRCNRKARPERGRRGCLASAGIGTGQRCGGAPCEPGSRPSSLVYCPLLRGWLLLKHDHGDLAFSLLLV